MTRNVETARLMALYYAYGRIDSGVHPGLNSDNAENFSTLYAALVTEMDTGARSHICSIQDCWRRFARRTTAKLPVTADLINDYEDDTEPHLITEDGVRLFRGDRAWNYYDLEWVTIGMPDRDGWFDCTNDSGRVKSLNGERLASREIRPTIQ